MDKFFRSKLNKKGFTIVELIVVIAIIGILLALILPAFFNPDKVTKGKAYAKSYFYTVQDVMAQRKVADHADPTKTAIPASFVYLYTTTDSTGHVVESGVIPTGSTTMTPLSSLLANTSVSEEYKNLVQKYAVAMENDIAATEFEGTFYAVVDQNFVVRAAYWSDGLMDELTAGNPDLEFETDNIISGYTCCAYPTEYSSVINAAGRKMLDVT